MKMYYNMYRFQKRVGFLTIHMCYNHPSEQKIAAYRECLLRTPDGSFGSILTANTHMFTYGYEDNGEFIVITKNGVYHENIKEII